MIAEEDSIKKLPSEGPPVQLSKSYWNYFMTHSQTMKQMLEVTKDLKKQFPAYVNAVLQALSVTVEINGYTREHCAAIVTSKDIRQLDEICRDVCIIRSRLSCLLQRLAIMGETVQFSYEYIHKPKLPANLAALRIQECCQSVMEFVDLQRDFDEFFKALDQKWYDIENRILEKHEQK